MHTPQYTMVLTDIRWMASPAALQLARFAGTPALPADELALDWNNAWRLAEGLCEQQEITAPVYAAMTGVNDALGSIPPTSTLWSDEAVAHDPRWERFRVAARAILVLLGEPYQDPNIDEAQEGGFHSAVVF
ncbi:hypothetical protein [Hymenobacter defluvii]|uniref:Uncharacterized protein n=1 Tax=Hymenobacter defluvii TaxID=2054411 RepID=A0ABS3TFA8_9BACT|nr:hypothetical protein [Hymenobacter defluvii]MBO3272343.1 hypothetical protein [Hymenobacter defluvii]